MAQRRRHRKRPQGRRRTAGRGRRKSREPPVVPDGPAALDALGRLLDGDSPGLLGLESLARLAGGPGAADVLTRAALEALARRLGDAAARAIPRKLFLTAEGPVEK